MEQALSKWIKNVKCSDLSQEIKSKYYKILWQFLNILRSPILKHMEYDRCYISLSSKQMSQLIDWSKRPNYICVDVCICYSIFDLYKVLVCALLAP